MNSGFLDCLLTALINLFSIIKIMAVLFSIILISAFVFIGFYHDSSTNLANLIGYERKKNINIFNEIEEIKSLKEEENDKERKLMLLTKFNTLVNKLMPPNLNDYLKTTYTKIYGDDGKKLLKAAITKKKHVSKCPKKVGFKKKLEEIEMQEI